MSRSPEVHAETHPPPVDELIVEEQDHLQKAERTAEQSGCSAASKGAVQHAKDQLGRAEVIRDYEKLLTQGSEFKTHLLSMATHDIKTPLTVLALQVHMLSEPSGLDEQRKRSVGIMKRSISRMTTMLDGFLDMARVEAGRLTIKPGKVDVGKLLRESVEAFEEAAKRKKLKLDVELAEELEGWGDAGRIIQVLSNLVSNAIRYSGPGGTIRLGANDTLEDVEIYVQDEGIGLTNDQISLVFRPFVQVQGIPEESEGSGLGLYLGQAIVKAHGGRLHLESPGPGKGTRATFTLPKNKAPASTLLPGAEELL